jgi:hypothetical protein
MSNVYVIVIDHDGCVEDVCVKRTQSCARTEAILFFKRLADREKAYRERTGCSDPKDVDDMLYVCVEEILSKDRSSWNDTYFVQIYEEDTDGSLECSQEEEDDEEEEEEDE